jgi:hypothetical protein
VLLDAPAALLVRHPGGTWNIEDALSPDLFQAPPGGEVPRLPAVRLRGGRVSIRDETGPPASEGGSAAPALREIDLSGIVFSAETRGGLVAFEGEVQYRRFERFKVAGTFDPKKKALDCAVRAAKVDLSGPIDRFLGEAASRTVRGLEIQGFADIERGEVHYDPQTGLVPVAVSGRLIRCQFSPPGLPFPVKQLGGRFALRGRTIEVKDLEGWFGAGRISGWANLEVDPTRGVERIDLLARAEAIPLDGRIRGMLDPGLRDVYDRFRPQGGVGIEVRVPPSAFPPRAEDIEASLTFNGVGFVFQDFPYPFQDLTGEAALKQGRLELRRPLTARHGEALLTVSGHADLKSFSPPATGEARPGGGEVALEAKVESLAVDEDLREALPLAGRKLFDDFHPAGKVVATVTVKADPASSPTPAAFVSLEGVRISYTQFPYEVTGIRGPVSVDFTRHLVTLSSLAGEHGGQPITARGVVEWFAPGEPAKFSVDIHCDDLKVDENLKAALSGDARRLLDDFRFQGRARTDITVHSLPAGETGVQVKVGLIDGKVEYSLFPYPLVLSGGSVKAIGPHSLTFEDVVTRELPPGGRQQPKVRFNGGIAIKGGERLLDFNFDIRGLEVDDQLRRALPPDLKDLVKNIGLQGTFNGTLEGKLTYPLEQPDRSRLVYLARDVTADDAAVDFGVQLRHMKGEGSFGGGRDEKGNHFLEGEVRVKTASFNRLHLSDGDISFIFGRPHPVIEDLRSGKLPPGSFHPQKHLLDRLIPQRVRDSFQMLIRKGSLYQGDLRGFLFVDVGPEHDLEGEFQAEGVNMGLAAPDIFGVSETGVSGDARGHVTFKGVTGDPLSILGSGEGRIEKARLYQLPLFVGLLNLLFGEFSTEHFFNEVQLLFQIRDGKFRAAAPDGMVIKSQGMHMKGGGTMDFDGNLDLSLSPEFLRLKIPLVDQVLGLLKKGLAQVWITGDIAKPEVRFVTGAGFVRIPMEAKPKAPDRPLPSELREGAKAAPPAPKPGDPLPPPPEPKPPEPKAPAKKGNL